MSTDCIFCKIIKGEIPSFTVYEDDTFKVILDRFPAAPGHALIIPKVHADDMFDLPEETAAKLYPLAKKIATKIKNNRKDSSIDIKTSIIIVSICTLALIVYILFRLYL